MHWHRNSLSGSMWDVVWMAKRNKDLKTKKRYFSPLGNYSRTHHFIIVCGRDAQNIDAHFFCLRGNLPLIDSSSIERRTPSSRYLPRLFINFLLFSFEFCRNTLRLRHQMWKLPVPREGARERGIRRWEMQVLRQMSLCTCARKNTHMKSQLSPKSAAISRSAKTKCVNDQRVSRLGHVAS